MAWAAASHENGDGGAGRAGAARILTIPVWSRARALRTVAPMGGSYANLTVLGHGHHAVVRALRGEAAFVTAPEHGATVVFPERDDDAGGLGERLSSVLACPVLGVQVAGDHVLLVHLWAHGVLVHRSCSPDPGRVPGRDDVQGATGAPADPCADRLVVALGRGDIARVHAILEDDDARARERHADLVDALGLPSSAVGRGHRDLAETAAVDGPDGLTHLPCTPPHPTERTAAQLSHNPPVVQCPRSQR